MIDAHAAMVIKIRLVFLKFLQIISKKCGFGFFSSFKCLKRGAACLEKGLRMAQLETNISIIHTTNVQCLTFLLNINFKNRHSIVNIPFSAFKKRNQFYKKKTQL